MTQASNFNPEEFAKWVSQGLKETLLYRFKQTLNREKLIEQFQANLPTQNQSMHWFLRRAFETGGFQFEKLKQGDAEFFLVRKTFRQPEPGQTCRRIVLVPGFGDTPASWIPVYSLLVRTLQQEYDEIILIDFPGYMGFLSRHPLVPSMKVILGLVKTVCEANPPTVLIGHSLGGWLAAKVSQELKIPIEHLILIAPSGLIPEEEERIKFAEFIVKNQERELEEILGLVVHDSGRLKYLLSDDFKKFFNQPEVKSFVYSVRPEDFVDPKVPLRSRKLTTIWGESDRFVPSQWTRYWVEHYGSFLDAYLMKTTGHIPQLERPVALAKILAQSILKQGTEQKESRAWVKIQSRNQEYDPQPLRVDSSLILPGPTPKDS